MTLNFNNWTLFKEHCFPWQVGRNWCYLQKILDHEGKGMMKEKIMKLHGNCRAGDVNGQKERGSQEGTESAEMEKQQNLPSHGFPSTREFT